VEGEGVHKIAVGPVHAGTIEPGHFRFSVVGEKVLRLEQQLSYAHKGIGKRFEQLTLSWGQRLEARVSGDTAVAFSWTYCMALEAICGNSPPPRALYLRALLLERERLANHLGDLGGLGRDAVCRRRAELDRFASACASAATVGQFLPRRGFRCRSAAVAVRALSALASVCERDRHSSDRFVDPFSQ